jgi:hypothetical protein
MIQEGDRCKEHDGAEWIMPLLRERGAKQEYLGHVIVDTSLEGAVFVFWHPMDLLPRYVPPAPRARARPVTRVRTRRIRVPFNVDTDDSSG